MDDFRATVVVLTFNGAGYLDEVLTACLGQNAPFRYEVLVVDSGSTDGTLEIVARHPEARLHTIRNQEFGHGRTRNLAAGLARGDFVVFLTQDATPIGPSWLAELLAPFASDPNLAGVFARQVPRPGCSPAGSREVAEAFRDPPPGFFSNVCSAVRKSVLEVIAFRDVDYAEDQAFATDVRAAGYTVAYARAAAVHHSHDLHLGAYFRRMYDEAAGLRAIGRTPRTGPVWLMAATAAGIVKDWRFVASDPGYGMAERVGWVLRVPAYNMARRLAIWLGARDLPPRASAFLSLDTRRRVAARP